MYRSSVSIGENIAEGHCRDGDAELSRLLQIAMGSASELEYHLFLSRHIELLKEADYELLSEEVTEVKRMLASLIQKLRAESRLLTALS